MRHMCYGKMESRNGKIELRVNGRLFLVVNVSYQQCESCGERILAPEISQAVFRKVQSRQYTQKQIVTPVIQEHFAMPA